MNLNDYLAKKSPGTNQVPSIICADGLKMSVQASESHYCTPRNNAGPYSHVEIGFPNQVVEALLPYVDDPEDPTGTVYSYVPIEVVEQVIADNGGSSQLS